MLPHVFLDLSLIGAASQQEKIIIFRDANQRFLSNLFNAQQKADLENEQVAKSFNILIAAGFSLWRASFLTIEKRDNKKILEQGLDVLKKLIDHNSINYQQEHTNKEWMIGYYLNNAKYRLMRLKKKLIFLGINSSVDFASIEDLSLVETKDMNQAWILFHNSLVVILDEIIGAYPIKQ